MNAAAVIRGKSVVGTLVTGDADRDSFLADRLMNEARNFAVAEQQ